MSSIYDDIGNDKMKLTQNYEHYLLDPSFASLGPLNGNGTGLDALWISLYIDGPDKPFIYHNANGVLTGVCKIL